MRFLADMGVDMRVVRWLRDQGHDAIHLRDEGLHRLPNGLIFHKGAAEARVVIAFDLDFGEIAAAARDARTGILLFRLRNTRTPNVLRRLAAVLPLVLNDLTEKRLVVIEEWRFRVREFPS